MNLINLSISTIFALLFSINLNAQNVIKNLEMGTPIFLDSTYGDTWITTWADNDTLYCTADDTGLSPTERETTEVNALNSNRGIDFYNSLALYKISGDKPTELSVTAANPMSEYNTGHEPCFTWKATGITCVDGVLYMAIGRHDYPYSHNPPRENRKQLTMNASIIKSTDHGKTWSRSEKENFENPMFPGSKFGAPYFFDYGKNYEISADGSDKYLYAISNDGYWNNGHSMVLGRVEKTKLKNLVGKDWEFYKGNGKDGSDAVNWTSNVDKALPVLVDSNKVGMSSVAYIKPLRKYLLFQWYFPPYSFCGDNSYFKIRESTTPWGPWIIYHEEIITDGGWYNPAIISKFTSPDGKRFFVSVGGDCRTLRWYKFTVLPFTILK